MAYEWERYSDLHYLAFAKMEFMEKLHPIMFAGTGSDVGKSIIAAAFCRIFKQDAISPHRSRHRIWR